MYHMQMTDPTPALETAKAEIVYEGRTCLPASRETICATKLSQNTL